MLNGFNPHDRGVWIALGIFAGAFCLTRFPPTRRFLNVTGFRVDRFLMVATAIAGVVAFLISTAP